MDILRKQTESEEIPDYQMSQFKHVVESVDNITLKKWTAVVVKSIDKKKTKAKESKSGWFSGWFSKEEEKAEGEEEEKEFMLTEEELEEI